MPRYRFTVVIEADNLETAEDYLLMGECWEDDSPVHGFIDNVTED